MPRFSRPPPLPRLPRRPPAHQPAARIRRACRDRRPRSELRRLAEDRRPRHGRISRRRAGEDQGLLRRPPEDEGHRRRDDDDRRLNRDASSLLPDGRRWRGAPDERLPLQQGGATAPLRLNDERHTLIPCPSPIREKGSPRLTSKAHQRPARASTRRLSMRGSGAPRGAGGIGAASVEPGCGADGLSHHPHAPWRSARRRFVTAGRAYRVDGLPSPRAVSTPVPLIGLSRLLRHGAISLMPPTVPASSSHRGRITPRAVPAASRVRLVRPAAGAAPIPTNGVPPDGCPSGMRWWDYGGGVGSGD